MKKFCFCIFFVLLLGSGCAKRQMSYLDTLDQTIGQKAYYDAIYHARLDSLRLRYLAAGEDSARWEAAYQLEKIFFYHDVDSCHSYVRRMLALQGEDGRRKSISGSCYANILYKMDSLAAAQEVFERIDTSQLTLEGLRTYSYAGYHIYRKQLPTHPGYIAQCRNIIDRWWQSDSTNIECAYYHSEEMRRSGTPVDGIRDLNACVLTSPNDTAKAYYFFAKEYLEREKVEQAARYFASSAVWDLRVSAKAYNSLYELARILFKKGDIQRADRYMRMTLEDAESSHYALRYDDIVLSEFEIMNVLLSQHERNRWNYLVTIVAITLMLVVAIVLLMLLGRYSKQLSISTSKLNEVSKIKDSFLANYMEKCVDYLNKVDEYRSSLRHTAKQNGPEAIMAMLRKPSFATGEFHELLNSLDTTFLGIFPDFVDKVNEHMQEGYKLEMPSKGELSTELRILAIIKMGISKRQKIAKILNMSVTTVYSYHCNLQKHSLHPDGSFDKVIAGL